MNILIFGCTGLVGKTLIKLIEKRKFSYSNIILVASQKNVGKKLKINNYKSQIVNNLAFAIKKN